METETPELRLYDQHLHSVITRKEKPHTGEFPHEDVVGSRSKAPCVLILGTR